MSSSYPIQTVQGAILRLQSQACGLFTPAAAGRSISIFNASHNEPDIPDRFSSMGQAKECLELSQLAYISSKYNTQRPVAPESNKFATYRARLSCFSSALESMLRAGKGTMTDREQRAANVLQIRALLFQIVIKIRMQDSTGTWNEMWWDDHHHSFAEIVQLAERVYGPIATSSSSSDRCCQRFTMDLGIVGCLYDTARVCRDPLLRRKAIQLLRQSPCREGLWDSHLAASTATRQMELEEACVIEVKHAQDVPGWARIITVVPKFQSDQNCASVVYTRQRVDSEDLEPRQFFEVVEWR